MSKKLKPKLRRIKVQLKERSYFVNMGCDAVRMLLKWESRRKVKHAVILSDESLLEARALLLGTLKNAGWEVSEIPLQAGESLKDFQSVYPIYSDLIKKEVRRDTVLFALGGGTIGDVAGFIAATYLRGIEWVAVPTTLLSQVDSAIGGKVAINHEQGKNLIGAFHQPSLVVCDFNFLSTLGRRELISGLGEIIKIALTHDAALFRYLEKNTEAFLCLEPAVMSHAVFEAVKWKAKAVSKDEFDRKGLREVLNFGHTFGHALESVTEYGTYQHGEAVIWGMRYAMALSEVRHQLLRKNRELLDDYLKNLDVPALPGREIFHDFINRMKVDKKFKGGKLHFVLLKGIGKTCSDSKTTEVELRLAYQLLQKSESETLSRST